MKLEDLKAFSEGTVCRSPITERDTCIVEKQENGTENFLDLETGYYTANPNMQVGSQDLEYLLNQSPKIVKEKMFTDKDTGLVWLLGVLQIPNSCIIHPESDLEGDGYHWKSIPLIRVSEEDRIKLQNKDPQTTSKYDKLIYDGSKSYLKTEFWKAMVDAGALVMPDPTQENSDGKN